MRLQDTTAGASPGVSVSVGTGASPLTGTTSPSRETSSIDSTPRSDGTRTGNARKDDGGDGDNGGGKDGGSGGASSKQSGDAQHGDGRTRIFDKQSFSYLVRSGIAGGMAGCAAKTVVGPLDRVKILFQTANPQFRHYSTGGFGVFQSIRDIYRSDGVPGLFRGHSATLLRIFPYAAIRFLAYEQYRSVLIPTRDHETSLRRLFSGSLAGMTSVFATYPLEVVRVRLAFETRRGVKSSLRATAREIYNEHPPVRAATSASSAASTAAAATQQQVVTTRVGGLSNFYRGFTPTIVGIFPYAGMAFLTHDVIHDFFYSDLVSRYTTIANTYVPDPYSRSTSPTAHSRPQLTAPAELVSGGLAGLISQTSSYPLEVIRRRMQVAGAVGDGHRLSILETARLIFRERGFRGFWVGLTVGYLKVVPMGATSFFVYERVKWLTGI